ncbi:DUF3140 domain-containing protein [Pseudonocardia asaccharolytica]|uniref:DUF3140 domain-containing protein n=1 Tax=Pseudonocardia asaccharolytica DSM 44247 = NBRC 16224 TaxID=1123024 RepID=A0A511CYV3_9PSEU|nr:DUF3140 domain-containing protein [Pseudonocardia asaccharolytica]GEL17739.1 hypothetical protein PA7_15760 [Pseudonocardia asaccharolytica DSM 44247 = NBRC 16224]
MAEHVDDELWDEFHRVVNMTSRELREWLMTHSAGEDSEIEPDHAGTPTGREVLDILGKRRADLTAADARTMRKVVQRVHEQRRDDLEPTAGQTAWRHRLMRIGHDPLRPVDTRR